jgi:large conductance mechanosensitive channel
VNKINIKAPDLNHPAIKEGRTMLKEFKEFAMRGSVIDMAVGIIIGAAFGTIVQSLVNDIIMPPIGMILGHVDFANLFAVLKAGTTPGPYASLAAAQAAGAVTINYGMFINKVISFVIVAFALFFLIRSMNSMKRNQETPAAEPTTKECPYCLLTIPIKAIKCGYCTADLDTSGTKK